MGIRLLLADVLKAGLKWRRPACRLFPTCRSTSSPSLGIAWGWTGTLIEAGTGQPSVGIGAGGLGVCVVLRRQDIEGGTNSLADVLQL